MPKSSMASLTPISFNAWNSERVWGSATSSSRSVSSSTRITLPGAKRARKLRQSSSRLSSRQWAALMLKPTWKPSDNPACSAASRSATTPMMRLVMGTIRPLASAWGMKRSGRIRPTSGCCQRISTSTPMMRSLPLSTRGCR
ncbi:hypothetical protein D3C79_897550 [compost metagenome]